MSTGRAVSPSLPQCGPVDRYGPRADVRPVDRKAVRVRNRGRDGDTALPVRVAHADRWFVGLVPSVPRLEHRFSGFPNSELQLRTTTRGEPPTRSTMQRFPQKVTQTPVSRPSSTFLHQEVPGRWARPRPRTGE